MSLIIRSIPEEYVEGFVELNNVDTKTFNSIIEGLSVSKLSHSIKSLADRVSNVTSIPYKSIEEIFFSVGSLAAFIEKGISSKDIVESVCIAIKEDGELDFKTPEEKEKFAFRLLSLIETKQLFYAFKANDIIGEYKNVFLQARVISDIRPVFSDKLEDSPEVGLIVHNLHIHYKADEEGAHKDIFLALDAKDIEMLKNALIRAEKKEKSLQSIFDKANMINLNSNL